MTLPRYLHNQLRRLGLVALAGTMAMSGRAAQAVGDSATKFNVFVPANVMSGRNSYLVVTNVSAVTAAVDIEDDATDGDSDDSAMGVSLAAGESYVVRIRDGAVNDDAGGKWDGDYFKVRADHPVMVFMGTSSSWQHDWVPSVGKSGIGTSFYLFSLPTSGSNADVNVFAYEDNTTVTLTDITASAQTGTGKATVNLSSTQVVLRSVLNQGEDLNLRRRGLGVDALQAGHSYLVRATAPVTVQTGHLGALNGGNQARDGGGFVPSANGSSLGSLFYLGIPHELGLAREKELRISCPSAASVSLFGASASSPTWSLISSSSVAAGSHLDFVGASNAAFMNSELYKLTVSPAYLGCNVYEANWMETGSFGTSDSASVVSSDEGQGLGYRFSAYVGPPGSSLSAVPTGLLTNNAAPSEGYASHLWIYATQNDTGITVQDQDRSGAIVSRTFSLNADQFYDFVIDKPTYLQLTASGVRPYLRVAASKPVTVLSGNVNDNWLTYFQSVVTPTPVAKITTTQQTLSCGDTATLTATCDNSKGGALSNPTARLTLPSGVQPVAGSWSATPSSSSASEVVWSGSLLAGGGSLTFSTDVRLSCAALGCTPSDLSTVRLECRGQSAGDFYASTDTTNLILTDSSRLSITAFSAVDAPDEQAANPSPHVTVQYAAAGSGSGNVTLERIVNSALPQTTATALVTHAGAQTTTFTDSYDLHYEETRFYRLRVVEGSCTRLMGPLAVRTSSGQSGGIAGGLESNGRLASSLARRAIARSSWAGVRGQEADTGSVSAALDNGGASPFLLSLLPATGPDGAAPVNATPGDLPGLTNAKAVASADYLDRAGSRVGTVLLVETAGEPYEHSKVLCDRAGGAHLDLVDEQRVQPEGSFLRTELRSDRHRSGESALEFKLFEQADGSFRAYSAWLQEHYPKPAAQQRVLNVQVWSMRPGFELALAADVLHAVGAAPPAAAAVPTSYFQQARTLGGHVEAILSSDASDGLTLRATRLLPSGLRVADEMPVRMLQLATRYPLFSEVTLELLDASHRLLDRVWMSDGAWTSLDDSTWGGKTRVDSASTTGCVSSDEAVDEGVLRLAGCASIRAQVSEFAGVARHLGGGFAPLDVSAYGSVSFTMQSNRSVRVCLESTAQAPGGQPCIELAALPQASEVSLPLAAFVRSESCESAAPDGLETVSFVSREPGALDLSVSSLRFGGPAANPAALLPCIPKSAPMPQGGCTMASRRAAPGELMLTLVALIWLSHRRSRATRASSATQE